MPLSYFRDNHAIEIVEFDARCSFLIQGMFIYQAFHLKQANVKIPAPLCLSFVHPLRLIHSSDMRVFLTQTIHGDVAQRSAENVIFERGIACALTLSVFKYRPSGEKANNKA